MAGGNFLMLQFLDSLSKEIFWSMTSLFSCWMVGIWLHQENRTVSHHSIQSSGVDRKVLLPSNCVYIMLISKYQHKLRKMNAQGFNICKVMLQLHCRRVLFRNDPWDENLIPLKSALPLMWPIPSFHPVLSLLFHAP